MEKCLGDIQSAEDRARKLKDIIASPGSDMHMSDLYLIGAISRTIGNCSAMRAMIIAQNSDIAACILRLQIDTASRVNALNLVSDSEKTCDNVIKGISLRKQSDRAGRKMLDVHLIDSLSIAYTWVRPTYNETSSRIHLSETHFFGAIHAFHEENGTFELAIPPRLTEGRKSLLIEISDAFCASVVMTEEVMLSHLNK